jgi:dynein heavy chain
LVCQAVIILTEDIIKSKGGSIVTKMVDGKKKEDYFDTAKRYLLSNPQEMLDMLLNYNKAAITEKQIKKLDSTVNKDPKFTLESA